MRPVFEGFLGGLLRGFGLGLLIIVLVGWGLYYVFNVWVA